MQEVNNESSFYLDGTFSLWRNTKITVIEGERFHIIANSNIFFSKNIFGQPAWPRNASGTDPNGGGIEEPAHNYNGSYGEHKAGELRKNSLVCMVNGVKFQAGIDVHVKMPASGELYIGINDNYFEDNTGGWDITIINETQPEIHGNAFVFVRRSGAVPDPNDPTGMVLTAGHVGWAFSFNRENEPSKYLAGGTENHLPEYPGPITPPDKKGLWYTETSDITETMTIPPLTPNPLAGWTGLRYDLYKKIPVKAININGAKKEIFRISKTEYNVVTSNCLHDTFHILLQLGAVLPKVHQNVPPMFPNDWFDSINANETLVLKSLNSDLDFTFHWEPNYRGKRFTVIKDKSSYNISNLFSSGSLVLRKGFAAIYSNDNLSGVYKYIYAPIAINNLEQYFGFKPKSFYVGKWNENIVEQFEEQLQFEKMNIKTLDSFEEFANFEHE